MKTPIKQLLVFTLFFTFLNPILGQITIKSGFYTPEIIKQEKKCITDEQRIQLLNREQWNIKALKESNKLIMLRSETDLEGELILPIRAKEGFVQPGFHARSNFVDLDPAPNSILDWNCGTRTYDGHLGTDFRLWPFRWHQVDSNSAEIIAAYGGQIIDKNDGEFDENCEWAGQTANYVSLLHSDGTKTRYWHMKNGSVTSKGIGEMVQQGEYLGVIASSGISTGPHLHFEVEDSEGKIIDPYQSPCNGTSSLSLWKEQIPYFDSQVNKIVSHFSDIEAYPDCPERTFIDEARQYQAGDHVWLNIYIREINTNQAIDLKIFTPRGDLVVENTLVYPGDYAVVIYASFDFEGLSILKPGGMWKVELSFEGKQYEHNFGVVQSCEDLINSYEVTDTKCGESNGKIELFTQGANIPYSYDFGNGFQESHLIEDLDSGIHQVIVSDFYHCTDTLNIEVKSSEKPIIELSADTLSCLHNEANLYFFSESELGSVLWSGPLNFQSNELSPVAQIPGIYQLRFTDIDGCEVFDTIEVIMDTTLIPVADFTYETNELEVQFTDLSTGYPDNFQWEFGDGNTSGDQNPIHKYEGDGLYQVCLYASTYCGTDTLCQEVEVVEMPSSANETGAWDSIQVFPNPFEDNIYVRFPGPIPGKVEFTIRNTEGQMVYNKSYSNLCFFTTINLDLSGIITDGVYLLEVRIMDRFWVEKVVNMSL